METIDKVNKKIFHRLIKIAKGVYRFYINSFKTFYLFTKTVHKMKKITYLILAFSIFGCSNSKEGSKPVKDSIESVNNAEYLNIEFSETNSNRSNNFKINRHYKTSLEQNDIIDFTKIKQGDKVEFKKLKEFNPNNKNFLKKFYGECWNSRPKTFRELDFVETKRKSLFKLDETNIDLLKIFDMMGFNFNNKNRIYASDIKFTGKHICNDKIYNYYIGISILYKVKLSKGNIVISNLEELGANVSAKKAEVEYFYRSEGIQINTNSTKAPKYSATGSGIFNKQTKIELDNKIDYFLDEIAKKEGAFIGRPFPEDFKIIVE